MCEDDLESFIKMVDLSPKDYLKFQLSTNQNAIFHSLVIESLKTLLVKNLINLEAQKTFTKLEELILNDDSFILKIKTCFEEFFSKKVDGFEDNRTILELVQDKKLST